MEERITTLLKEMITKAGFSDCTVSAEQIGGQTTYQIHSKDSRHLIGMRGETLKAIDYLLKKMVEKGNESKPTFLVDVDGYRAKEIQGIEQKAKMMAERARSFKYDVELTPMSSYERLIVHAALAGEANIKTESRGEGRDRRVVICYTHE